MVRIRTKRPINGSTLIEVGSQLKNRKEIYFPPNIAPLRCSFPRPWVYRGWGVAMAAWGWVGSLEPAPALAWPHGPRGLISRDPTLSGALYCVDQWSFTYVALRGYMTHSISEAVVTKPQTLTNVEITVNYHHWNDQYIAQWQWGRYYLARVIEKIFLLKKYLYFP